MHHFKINRIFLLVFAFVFHVVNIYAVEPEKIIYKKTDTRDLAINIYYPESKKPNEPTPAIVYFFGGGWVGGNPDHFKSQCEYLASRGIIAIAPDYRIASKDNSSPIESVMDAKSAIRFLKYHANDLMIDTSMIAVAGGSAGGHLAASTATLNHINDPDDDLRIHTMPDLLLLYNPVVDCTSKGYGANKLGKDTLTASPVYNLSKEVPPTIIFHGTADNVVPYENVEHFQSRLNEFGTECILVPFPEKGHGFFNKGRADNIDYFETLYLTDRFLIKHGFLDENPNVYFPPKQSCYVSPLMSGEVTSESAILQARLVELPVLQDNDVVGITGVVQFEWSTDSTFAYTNKSSVLNARQAYDFIVKQQIKGLDSDRKYFYRARYGQKEPKNVTPVQSFSTMPGPDKTSEVSFVMVTGSHYDRFYGNWGTQLDEDVNHMPDMVLDLGFPGHKAVHRKAPDFYIGNGDNVYYDHVKENRADSLHELRTCWHRQFSLPRFQNLLKTTPVLWMKDDHDYRFDDADTSTHPRFGDLPGHILGMDAFIEQVPLMDGFTHDFGKPYRTFRVNADLQIWLVEGRDYRSPNSLPDDEDKSIWGKEQYDWLKKTMLASDATFKLLVSPTPMVGPDDKRKTDNHTNFGGFRTERERFFVWLKEQNFIGNGFYILCGDRHWQYHSIHPTGIEEFSCGALVERNSRVGRMPGDPNSTDPEGKIFQPYTQKEASAGFLEVNLTYEEKNKPVLNFSFFDENGLLFYTVMKEK